jgi:hypothetical protein
VLTVTQVTKLLVFTFITGEDNPQFSTENCIILFATLVWMYFLFLPFIDLNYVKELLSHVNAEGLLLGKEFLLKNAASCVLNVADTDYSADSLYGFTF